jgi:transitional endoplasmic reticulum ATPase
VPEVGDNVSSSILGSEPALFRVVRRTPDAPAVVGVLDTRVEVLPVISPSLEERRSKPPRLWQAVSDAVLCCVHSAPSLSQIGLPQPRIVLVVGPYGVGKTSAIAAAALSSGAELLRVTASDVLRRSVTRSGIWAAFRRDLQAAVAAAPAVLLVDDAHFLFPPADAPSDEWDAVSALARLADELYRIDARVCVVLAGSPGLHGLNEAVLQYADHIVEMSGFSARDHALWGIRASLENVGRVEDAEKVELDHALVQQAVGMTIADVASAAGSMEIEDGCTGSGILRKFSSALTEIARSNSVSRSAGGVTVLHSASRAENDRGGILEGEKNGTRAANVAGMEDVVLALHEAIEWGPKRRHVFERLGVRPAAGILLYGPPGTGKTLAVRQVSAACNATLLAVDAATLARGEVGASERILREVYAKASGLAPAVVFLDEVDALFVANEPSVADFGSAGGARNGGTGGLGRLADALLRALDGTDGAGPETRPAPRSGLGVTTVAATNRPWRVPRSLLRAGRLERCVHVGLPSTQARAAVSDLHASLAGFDDRERAALRTWAVGPAALGASGADIAGAFRRAALAALVDTKTTVGRGSQYISAEAVARAFAEAGPSVTVENALDIAKWRPPV